MDDVQPEKIIRLSVSEAARLFGVDARTVRRAIKEQKLRYIVVRGRYKIHFSSLVDWSQLRTKIRNKRDTDGIGQYVELWKMKNTLYSPNPKGIVSEDGKVKKKRRGKTSQG